MPALGAYIAETAAPDQRGAATGLLRTTQDAALVLGPTLTGVLSDQLGLGYQGGLAGCVVLLIIATFAFIQFTPARHRS
jgi:MFS family permease